MATATLELESTAGTQPVPLRARAIVGAAELPSLIEAWRALDLPSLTPMQSPEWTTASIEAFADLGRLELLAEIEDGQLCAIAPCFGYKSWWPRCREMIGVELITEPMDLIYTDPAALERLIARLTAWGRPLFLPRVPIDSPTIEALRRAFAGRAVIIDRPQPTSPYITLSADWTDPESQLTSRRRSDLRRARKRAEETGPVHCEIVCPDPADLDSLLDMAWAIEARSWKGAAGTALIHDPLRTAFYRRYAHHACEAGQLRLCWLRFGSQTVAMQIAIEAHQRFWLLKIGYDEQFARCSPGNLLIAETLRYAAEQQLVAYEFLGMSADWTRVWTEQERASTALRIYPYNVLGMAALAGDVAKRGQRKLLARLPWAR
jgi:CelD/BcsL family acetyltransferase involved in cellulose biosynthesis